MLNLLKNVNFQVLKEGAVELGKKAGFYALPVALAIVQTKADNKKAADLKNMKDRIEALEEMVKNK